MKFKADFKRFFYGFFVLLFLSGGTWWAMEKWLRVQTALGEDHHPWQGILIRMHGTLAYFFMLMLGYLVHSHVRPGLNAKKKRSMRTGWMMIAITALLILTSAMDMFGPEGEVREFLVTCHRFLGLSFPIVLIIHLVNRKFHTVQKVRHAHGDLPTHL